MKVLQTLALLLSISPWISAFPVFASDYDQISIRLDKIENRGFWFDVEIGLGARPDFQATITVEDGDGNSSSCLSPRFENMETVSHNQVLCTVTVRKPYRLTIHLVDHDARDSSSQQVADLDPDSAGMDFITPIFDHTVVNYTTTTPGHAAVTFTVSARPVIPTLRFDGINAPHYLPTFPYNPYIDPSAGQQLSFSGAISPGGKIRVSIIPKSTITALNDDQRFALQVASDFPVGFMRGNITFAFSGAITDFFAFPSPKTTALPPGVYIATLTHLLPDGDVIKSASREFEIRAITKPQLAAWSIPADLDIDAEPFLIKFSSTQAGVATVDIFTAGWTGSNCDAGFMGVPPEMDPSDAHFDTPIEKGLNEVQWDGIVGYGLLAPGSYCVAVRAKTPGGQAFEGAAFRSFRVKTPPMPGLVVTTAPISPALRHGPAVVEATAVDQQLRPVLAKQIELFVGGYNGPGSPAPALAKVCTGVRTCQVAVPLNVGTVAYEARLSNARGAYTTGVRLTDVIQSPYVATYRLSAAAEYLPSDPPVIREVPRSRTIDVIFHAGDGYALDRQPHLTTFVNRLQQEMLTLSGNGLSVRSSVFNNLGSVSFFVSKVPAQVTQAGINFGACLRTVPHLESYADVNAVLHPALACRDYASGSIYTGESARVSWHEFHHIAYGLADEYCADTYHYQPPEFPNLFAGLAQCQALSSNPAKCKSISDPANCPKQSCTCNGGFFKSDPGITGVADYSDVMHDNTVERADDLRAANGRFNACRLQRC